MEADRKNLENEKNLTISISREHANFLSEIKEFFPNAEVNTNYIRKSLGDLPLQVMITLGNIIVGGIVYDVLKAGVKKIFKKFRNAKVMIYDDGINFLITDKNKVKVLVVPEREKEFEHIKNIDDLIEYLHYRKMGWKITNLGSLADIKGGKRLPKGENLVSYKTDHPYIRITDLENNQIKKNQLQFITDDTFESISRYIVNTGDVIVSIVGSIGFVARIDEDLDNANLTENCVKFISLNNIDSKYLYYFLISKIGQNEIQKNTVGAVQKKLPIYGVQNIKIFLPPLPEQKAIASVLSAFDDKIELLREENKTLEEIGQTIFKEWFGKYKVGDELPEGWRVGKLGEICSLKSGFAFKGEDFVKKSKNMVLKIKDLKGSGYIDLNDISFVKDSVKNSQRVKIFELQFGDIVLAMSGNTTGKIGVVPIVKSEIFLNQRVGKFFVENEKYNVFIYFFLMSNNYEEKILNLGYGSAQPNINPKQIEDINIIYPEDKIFNEFNIISKNVFDKILKNLYQIESLSCTRDELLPKLMSGEARVNGF